MVEYRRATRRLNAATLVGMEALDVAGPAGAVKRTDAPENAAAGSLDEEVQTPLHFRERFIDPEYTSSEWELRARALALYRIQQKRTEATETEASAAKVVGTTQTVERRDAETQAARDDGGHAIQYYRYWRRPYPAGLQAGAVAGVRQRLQATLSIDLDAVRGEADALRRRREAAGAKK